MTFKFYPNRGNLTNSLAQEGVELDRQSLKEYLEPELTVEMRRAGLEIRHYFTDPTTLQTHYGVYCAGGLLGFVDKDPTYGL